MRLCHAIWHSLSHTSTTMLRLPAVRRCAAILTRVSRAGFSSKLPSDAAGPGDTDVETDVAKQVEKMMKSDAILKLREQLANSRFSMAGIKAANKTRRVYQTVKIVSTASLAEMHRVQLRKLLTQADESSLEAAGFNYALVMDDSKVLYTPSGNVFAVPSFALAAAAAAEWDSQSDFVRVTTMPLTQMSTTVIDVWSNPSERQKKIETMMSFLQSDSISYRSSQPPALVRLQEKHWDPIMAFMVKEFKCKLPISTMWTGQDAKFDEDGFRRVRAYLESLDKWTLCTAEVVGGLCKSISMGLACVKSFRNAEQLCVAARVEENFQISQWGFVYGNHDIDIAYYRANLFGAQGFLNLLRHSPDSATYLSDVNASSFLTSLLDTPPASGSGPKL